MFALSAHAYTLVFRTGKVIAGRVLFEDVDTVRFQDDAGVAMTVKRSLLDIEATRLANKSKPPAQTVVKPEEKPRRPTTLAEVAKLNRATRTGTCRTLTNADVAYGPVASEAGGKPSPSHNLTTVGEGDLDMRLRKAEQTYDRLKSQCRAAGGGGAPVRHVATYLVGGKLVTVEGIWADPAAVSRAKQICARALQSQQELGHLQDELQRRHETSGNDAQPPASR
jgi:hypothetical protein